ncbi:hypothetical protein BDV93DRAFT_562674 [Ceratobasidium sp. AG-I]|nr:hypothetical protein BDV93DRAFT_562674 [Ceratobasidium sp. AG-I]
MSPLGFKVPKLRSILPRRGYITQSRSHSRRTQQLRLSVHALSVTACVFYAPLPTTTALPLDHHPAGPSSRWAITPLDHHPAGPSPRWTITPLDHHPARPSSRSATWSARPLPPIYSNYILGKCSPLNLGLPRYIAALSRDPTNMSSSSYKTSRSSSSVSSMLKLYRRPLKRPYPNNKTPSALDHIQFIDIFTMAEERTLHNNGMTLLTVAAANPGHWNMGAAEADQEVAPTATGNTRFMSSSPNAAPDDRRAAKRQATDWNGDDEAALSGNSGIDHPPSSPHNRYTLVGHQPPAISAAQPANDQANQATVVPGPAENLPTVNQAAPPVWQPNIAYGSSSYPVASFASQDYTAQLDPSLFGSTDTLADMPLGSPGFLINAPPDFYGAYTSAPAYQQTQPPMYANPGHSGWYQGAAFQAGLSNYLTSDPLVASPEWMQAFRDGESRYGIQWSHCEKQWIINYIVGPTAPAQRLNIAMITSRSPRQGEVMPKPWNELSADAFASKRDAVTIAQQWWTLFDHYCTILAHMGLTLSEPSADIIERLRQRCYSNPAVPIAGYTYQAHNWAAWVENGTEGWFSRMHLKLHDHPATAARVSFIHRSNRAPAVPRSVPRSSRSGRRARSTRTGSTANRPTSFTATTSAPSSAAGSGPLFDHPSQSSSTQEDSAHVPVFAPNLPAVLEMVRNQHAVSEAAIKLAEAKAEYLRAAADTARAKTAQHLLDIERSDVDQQHRIAIDVLNCQGAPDHLQAKATEVLESFLSPLRTSLNVESLVSRLARYIPNASVFEGTIGAPSDERTARAIEELVAELAAIENAVAPSSS